MVPLDPLKVCRLCLVDNNVDISIFEEEGEFRGILSKISSCLPVNITEEDKLSKKICNDCLHKVETFHQYWLSTAAAEKALLKCLKCNEDMEEDNYYHYKEENDEDFEQNQQNIAVEDTSNNLETVEIKEINNFEQSIEDIVSSDIVQIIPEEKSHEGEKIFTILKTESDASKTDEPDDITYNIPNIISNVMDQSIPILPMETNDSKSSDKIKTEIVIPKIKHPSSEKKAILKPFSMTRKLVQITPPAPLNNDTGSISTKETRGQAGTSGLHLGKTSFTIGQFQDILQSPKFVKGQRKILPKSNRKVYILANSNNIQTITTSNVNLASILQSKSFAISEIQNSEEVSENQELEDEKFEAAEDSNLVRRKTIRKNSKTNGPYKCHECDLIFQYQREVRSHAKVAHPTSGPVYKCDECNVEFKCRQSLKDHHIRKHTMNYQFVCHECGKKFKMKNDLYMHLQGTHRKDDDAICQFCNRVCRNKVALKKHIADMHNVRPYACNLCNRRLATLESLEAHEKLHERQVQVECEICKKTFTAADTLKKHMTIHTGIKPYSCKVCEKSFRRQHTYKQHLLLHTDVRPYFCDVCGMNFKQKPSLITHRKKHGPLPPLPAQSVDSVIKDLLDNDKSERSYF